MRRFWSVGLMASALAALSWSAQTNGSAETNAVRAVVSEYVQARNQKDEPGLRKLLVGDVDQLVSSGEWRRGAENLVNGAMASSRRENGTSSIDVETVRLVSTDVALVDGRYKTTSATGATRNMWTTLLLKKTHEGWRIAAIRNMLPAPPTHS